MATYKAVQDKVKMTYGFVPKTCWIADVFEFLGKKPRLAPNRIDPSVRKHPCPAEKRWAIIDVLGKLER